MFEFFDECVDLSPVREIGCKQELSQIQDINPSLIDTAEMRLRSHKSKELLEVNLGLELALAGPEEEILVVGIWAGTHIAV